MKGVIGAFLLFELVLEPAFAVVVHDPDRTITRVVKLLQSMLDKSKADGDEERTLYGKHKCYCDTNEAGKKASIDAYILQIGQLENQIDGLKASSGKLSEELAKLDADMASNQHLREQADSIRKDENAAFLKMEADYKSAITAMTDAINTLSDVGADQTLASAAADHNQFMKGNSLVKLRSVVRQALLVASAVTTPRQRQTVDSFVQAPFTGTYTAQAGEVFGILKDMRDTFTSNLQSATAAEQAQAAAHESYMETMGQQYKDMATSYQEKQDTLSSHDTDIGTKTKQLYGAKSSKTDDEQFLSSLLQICDAKAKEYDERTALRQNENAAIAEAIAILNSDAAFQTFGESSATKTGPTSLLQHKAVRVKSALSSDTIRSSIARALRSAALASGSLPLARVVALVEAHNPFTVVLQEIEKMIASIKAEDQADNVKSEWCSNERSRTNTDLGAKENAIIGLNVVINTLTNDIEDPSTGLKAQIQATEESLESNLKSQADSTEARKTDSAAYKKDVAHLVDAEQLLQSAIQVLDKYYAKILKQAESNGFLQRREEPAPPSTWDSTYVGQSGKGGDAISMLKFILSETKKEENAAHAIEQSSQHDYEDEMAALKQMQSEQEFTLANLKKTLAEKEVDLLHQTADLKATTAQKEALEAYLEQIKPGCDFIVQNLQQRILNRQAEAEALANAASQIKSTPAYQAAVAQQHTEDLGECAETCKGAEEHLKCKACLAKVTEPAYCAGHPTTQGC